MADNRTRRLSRRRFLATGAGLATLALLQACRPRAVSLAPTAAPTPTQTPRSVFLRPPLDPRATPDDTPTPPQATEPATATPTATEPATTAPQTDTPTPTPTATPFPPGPPTKLGLFITRNVPDIFTLAATRNMAIIKTLEHDTTFVTDLKKTSPNTLIIGRPTFLGQVNLDGLDPLPAARQFVDQLLPLAADPKRLPVYSGWESYNEPAISTPDQMKRYADFEAERVRLLAAAGIPSVVGNFGTGQPALELWPHFFPALQAVKSAGGFLGIHEYSAPAMWFGTGKNQLNPTADEGDEGWLTLRYRKVYRNYLQPAGLAVPLLITECGIDGMVGGRPGPAGRGWRDFVQYWNDFLGMGVDGPGNYIEQLAWYDAELRRDPYVKGAAVYALVASGGWQSYELQGPAAQILLQYLSVHPPR